MSVFISHLIGTALRDKSFGSLGRFGVILFFVHTSFVLMASLQRLEGTASSDIHLMLAFWIRRIFRIYPLAILCVVLVAVFRIPENPFKEYFWMGLKGFLSNLALIQNFTGSPNSLSVLWSLPLEVQMYAVLPLAFFFIRGRRRYRSLALWIASVLLALLLDRIHWRGGVIKFAPCFASGVVAFDLLRSRGWTWKLPAWVWPIGILGTIVLFGPHDDVGLQYKMSSAWGLSLFLGVLYANVKEGRSNWFYSVSHWIAEHSYGIYLSHTVILWFVFFRMEQYPLWLKIVVLTAGAIGVPAILYITIEKPLILVGGRIAKRLLVRSTKKGELKFA